MSKSRKSKDPFAKREAEKYSNPIPSRGFILQHLEQVGEPISHGALCKQLKLHDEELVEAMRRRLVAMSRDGQIISNRRGVFGLADHMGLLKGKVQGNKDGFGFFIPEDGSGDLFLNGREMEKLFDGDQVLARVSGVDSRGRKEGAVVEILKRRFEQIVGRYYHEQGFGIVVPDSKRISHEILIPDQAAGNAEDGQFVVAEITEYPSRRRKAIAKIVEVLGDSTTPGLEIDIALRSHDIPHEWPAAVSKALHQFKGQVQENDLAGRKDMRDIPFVTIDGEDAKDFDDAVYARQQKNGGWILYVAIADVSHYVSIGSALDEEAVNRATSVYFPGHVIPMLPEQLSNGLCSLKPAVDRLTMVCEMKISAAGEMTDYCFFEAVIHSHGRMTYTEVADIVQTPESDAARSLQTILRKRHESLLSHLDDLYSLYRALRSARDRSGAMDFDTTETRIVFGENKKIREIVPVYRTDAHRLIEECMLCANVAAAELLESSKLPALYRVHEGPNPEKLGNLREFLRELALYLPGGDKPEPSDYKKVLLQIANRPDKHLLQTMLIRSLMQAVYQPENLGHFGLGYPAYTHFTSPIRRYPDLLIHRAIRFLIRNKSSRHLQKQANAAALSKKQIYPYSAAEMQGLGEHCSMAERRADAAGYSVMDWLKCEYMQDKIGDEFSGTVATVTSFGLFVELNDIYIEGLVHITELSNDYYHFDPVRHCLEGERSRTSYRLGDTVEVKVMRVNLDEKKIDLQMVGMTAAIKPAPRRGKPGNRKGLSDSTGSKKRKKKGKELKKTNSKKRDKGNSEAKGKPGEPKPKPKGNARPGSKVGSNKTGKPGNKATAARPAANSGSRKPKTAASGNKSKRGGAPSTRSRRR
jgi:ribonuclease R